MTYFRSNRKFLLLSQQFVCLAFVTGVLISAGCGKHQPVAGANNPVPTAVSTPENGAANPTLPVKPNVVPITVVSAGADPAPMLAQLTQVLRRFSVEHRQVPKSLNELVAAGYLTALPAPPAGKQFAIAPKHLEVVLH